MRIHSIISHTFHIRSCTVCYQTVSCNFNSSISNPVPLFSLLGPCPLYPLNAHHKNKTITPPYLNSLVSKAVFPILQYATQPEKRRWWENKQTAVRVENWSWYWNCIIQASSRHGGMPCLTELVEKHRLWARWLAGALLSEFLWSLGMSARPVSSLYWKLLNNVSLLLAPSDGRHLYNHVYISLNSNSHFTTTELLL